MTILEKCAESFKAGRHHLILATALLYEIKSKELWKEKHETLTEYIEEECKMDKGQASRLLASYEHFVVNGPVEHAQLENVSLERLYLATKLKGSKATQFKQALLLQRGELKKQAVYEQTGEECPHTTVITICAKCHQRI